MNGQLPLEGQKVEVKLVEGEWQEAVYRGANFVDHYGLPLDAEKIAEWRPIDVAISATTGLNGPSGTSGRTVTKAGSLN